MPTKKKNGNGKPKGVALVKRDAFAFMQEDNADALEVIEENLQGEDLSVTDLTIIKTPSGGGIAWELDGPDGIETMQDLRGVIVAYGYQRQMWLTSFDEAPNEAPDCKSHDTKTGRPDPESLADSDEEFGGACAECAMAVWGSDVDDNGNRTDGQRCRKTCVMVMMLPDRLLPVVVVVPRTSLKPMRKYFVGLSNAVPPRRYYGVVTSLKLEKAKSAGNITYSRCLPSNAGTIDPELTDTLRKQNQLWKPMLGTADVGNAKKQDDDE